MKDIERDKAEGVLTFAVGLGIERTLRVLRVVNVLSMVALAAFVLAHLLPVWTLPVALVGLYVHWILTQAEVPGSNIEFLCDVAMDGEMFWWLPCAVLGIAFL